VERITISSDRLFGLLDGRLRRTEKQTDKSVC
jgi:hypothetical protein